VEESKQLVEKNIQKKNLIMKLQGLAFKALHFKNRKGFCSMITLLSH
jgi:hypothetical protein